MFVDCLRYCVPLIAESLYLRWQSVSMVLVPSFCYMAVGYASLSSYFVRQTIGVWSSFWVYFRNANWMKSMKIRVCHLPLIRMSNIATANGNSHNNNNNGSKAIVNIFYASMLHKIRQMTEFVCRSVHMTKMIANRVKACKNFTVTSTWDRRQAEQFATFGGLLWLN